MRGIKFRAWDTELKFFVDPLVYFVGFDGSVWFNNCADGDDYMTDQSGKLVIMQFTGFIDHNRKEVYAGDIVEISGDGYYSNESFNTEDGEWTFTGEVAMDSLMWIVINKKDDTYYPLCDILRDEHGIKIIGNKWENSELLK